MYQANGTYYTEDHSVSFGGLTTRSSGGVSYTDFTNYANTWSDWHLIPSSRPSIAHPTFVTKFVEIPGSDGMLDLSTFLTGRPTYGQRQGSLTFLVDNGHQQWETLRAEMVRILHGKKLKMRLMDDPTFYYDGYYTVGQWESGPDRSQIQISYTLDPYKIKINTQGSSPVLWDTFNFERDYDYYSVMSPLAISGSKNYTIFSGDYVFVPTVTWVSGSVSLSFGGVTQSLSSSGSKQLGRSTPGNNTLSVSGSGSVTITWRGGAL